MDSPRQQEERLPVGRVLAEVLRIYGARWMVLVPIAVVVMLPQTLVAVTVGPLEVERVDDWGDVAKLLALPPAVLTSLLGEAFYAGVVAAVVLEWTAGRPLPRPSALARAIPYRRLIAADLIIVVGAAIGFLLLIVPGIVFLTYFFIASAVIKLEGLRVREGFRRSAELVRGNFWRVLAIVTAAVLGTELVSDGLTHVAQDVVADLVAEVAVDAVLEPFQALATVLVALALIELHGGSLRLPGQAPTS